MPLKIVDLTLKVPKGSEEFVTEIVCRELKEFVTKTRKADYDQIKAEEKSEIKLIKQANGLIAVELPI